MTNRSDEELAKEFNALVQNLDRPVNAQETQETQDDATTSGREREVVALNELRVQMLEMLGSQKSAEDGRYCWVCFATDEDDKMAAWVQPCKCSGTTKWVHQSCLQRWVDEKQKGNAFKRVNCPQVVNIFLVINQQLKNINLKKFSIFCSAEANISLYFQKWAPLLAF